MFKLHILEPSRTLTFTADTTKELHSWLDLMTLHHRKSEGFKSSPALKDALDSNSSWKSNRLTL